MINQLINNVPRLLKFCEINFHELEKKREIHQNLATKFPSIQYPMPRIEEQLDRDGDTEFITTLDLVKGYWQVPMEREDKEKTAFTSPRGLYQFTTMPFGLNSAPATFQHMMDNSCEELSHMLVST